MREITRSVKVALKRLIAVVFVDVDLPYWTSADEHIVAFTAIVINICTARSQKRLFMHFRCKYRQRRSIRRPRFLVKVQNDFNKTFTGTFNRLRDFAHAQTLICLLTQGRELFSQITLITFIAETPTVHSE